MSALICLPRVSEAAPLCPAVQERVEDAVNKAVLDHGRDVATHAHVSPRHREPSVPPSEGRRGLSSPKATFPGGQPPFWPPLHLVLSLPLLSKRQLRRQTLHPDHHLGPHGGRGASRGARARPAALPRGQDPPPSPPADTPWPPAAPKPRLPTPILLQKVSCSESPCVPAPPP